MFCYFRDEFGSCVKSVVLCGMGDDDNVFWRVCVVYKIIVVVYDLFGCLLLICMF